MNFDLQATLLHLAVAALGGLAVGVEREWSASVPGEPARFGGVRTFLLLGLTGGLAAVLFRQVDPRLGLVLFAAGFGQVLVAYLVSAWRGNIDATSEVAGLLVLGAGAAAGWGLLTIASAVAATTALVLVEKSRMHAAVAKLESSGLEAGSRFAVLALVILPILPPGPIARLGGLEPQKLWGIVLLFAGLSFAGYIALRLAGPERGYSIVGFLGGLVSSTAVTFNFSRESRRHAADLSTTKALTFGVLAACAVLPLRVGVIAAVLNPAVARALLPALWLPFVAAAVAIALAWFRPPRGGEPPRPPENPLRLAAAIQMAVLFQLVFWGISAMRDRLGAIGLIASSAVLGLTDLDALTFSLTKLVGRSGDAAAGEAAALTAAAAARGLVVGMLSNTIFKLGVALALGAAAFRLRVAAALAVLAALFALGLLWI
ncbi:MAG: DUF4010 domain-containing protein [Thermoanaerobaculia bacterium]